MRPSLPQLGIPLVVSLSVAMAWSTPDVANAANSAPLGSASVALAAPGAYTASASGDLLDIEGLSVLPSVLPSGGTLANAVVGHAESTADSSAVEQAVAESSNINGSILFGGVPLSAAELRASAPVNAAPQSTTLVPVNLAPVVTLGALNGSVAAAAGSPCVAAQSGRRLTSQSTTTIAQSTLVDGAALGIGYLARIGASEITASTALVDNTATNRSDVVATTSATIGDISLLGGAASVHVSSPVTLEARSNGTTGTATLVDPATITITAGPTVTPIPLNGTPLSIPIALPANPLLGFNLQVTAFTPTNQSSGATGAATVDDLLRVSLDVSLLGLPVATVGLATAPLAVSALAPAGGVDCGQGPEIETPIGDPGADPDGDGLTNSDEQQNGTDPRDGDTDGDGLSDGLEVNGLPGMNCRSNPMSKDTDKDKLADGKEYNGFKMRQRVKTSRKASAPIGVVRTNPCKADTDGDKIKDGREVKGKKVRQVVLLRGGRSYKLGRLFSNPMLRDSDKDGLTDRQEITGSANKRFAKHKTDPLNYDTDGGRIKDGREVKLGSDPANAKSSPRVHRGNSRSMPWA